MITISNATTLLHRTTAVLWASSVATLFTIPTLSAQIGVVVTTGGGNGGAELLDIAANGATSNSRAISHQTMTTFGFVGLAGVPGGGPYSGLSRSFSGSSHPDHVFGIASSGLASPAMTNVYFGGGDCARDPSTGHLWGMKQTGQLYDLALSSSQSYQTTIVGAGGSLEAMAFDASGQLYVLQQGADRLHKVDKSTGLVTSSVAVGIDTGLGNAAMAFDPAKPTDLLVVAPVWNGSGAPHRLFSLNATTGDVVDHGTTRSDITGFVPFAWGSAGGNGNGGGNGVLDGSLLMDMESSAALAVANVTFDTGVSNPGGTANIDVYAVPESYVGNEYSPAQWVLVGSTESILLSPGAQTATVEMATTLTLPPGRYGIALHGHGIVFRYGTIPGCGSPGSPGACPNTTFANGEVTLRMGAALDGLFAGNSVGPAVFQGALGYRVGGAPMALARAVSYGVGCGSQGPVQLTASRPVLGTTVVLTIETGSPSPGATVGFLVLSLTRHDPGLSLAALGMPGCTQYVGLDAVHLTMLNQGLGTVSLSIPNDPSFVGLQIRAQAVVRDPLLGPLPLATSNGIDLTIGAR